LVEVLDELDLPRRFRGRPVGRHRYVVERSREGRWPARVRS
jgi:hypothetical protein